MKLFEITLLSINITTTAFLFHINSRFNNYLKDTNISSTMFDNLNRLESRSRIAAYCCLLWTIAYGLYVINSLIK